VQSATRAVFGKQMPLIEPYWETHGGTGPYLLLVHGFLSSQSQWLLNLDALKDHCRPVTVELFGHHRSPTPEQSACFEPAYYVRCFEAIRESLDIDRWFVLGYSLGAGLTLRYALEHPQRIQGHLFTNSTSGLADLARQQSFTAGADTAADKIRTGGQAAMERIPVHPIHGRTLPAPVYQALVADAAHHDPEGIARTLAVTNPAASMRSRLVENTRPACMIWGTKERRFRPLADYARAHMPLLTTVELDAGHGMNMQAPVEFNQAVSDFVQKCHTS
jgi:pimeloyl-ACP methyl ester carboxylesterase